MLQQQCLLCCSPFHTYWKTNPILLANYPSLRTALAVRSTPNYDCRIDQAADNLFILVLFKIFPRPHPEGVKACSSPASPKWKRDCRGWSHSWRQFFRSAPHVFHIDLHILHLLSFQRVEIGEVSGSTFDGSSENSIWIEVCRTFHTTMLIVLCQVTPFTKAYGFPYDHYKMNLVTILSSRSIFRW